MASAGTEADSVRERAAIDKLASALAERGFYVVGYLSSGHPRSNEPSNPVEGTAGKALHGRGDAASLAKPSSRLELN